MQGYCSRCKAALANVSEEMLRRGVCPTCGGQISYDTHTGKLGVDGAIGMTFAAGSSIGEPLESPFGQERLADDFDEDTAVTTRPKLPSFAPQDSHADESGEVAAPAEGEGRGGGIPPPALPDFLADLSLASSGKNASASAVADPLADATAGASGATFGSGLAGDLPPLFGTSGSPVESPAAVETGASAALPPLFGTSGGKLDVPPLFANPPAGAPRVALDLDIGVTGGAPATNDTIATTSRGEPAGGPAVRAVEPSEERSGVDNTTAGGSEGGVGVPAHLQLPTFDFALPSFDAGGAPPSPAEPGVAPEAPANVDLPAHLRLPTFPQFELPPIPGQEPPATTTEAAASLAGGAVEATAAAASGAPVAPPRTPPPPPRRTKSAPSMATGAPPVPDLPPVGLPSGLGAKKKELTLLSSDVAAQLAEHVPRKRPVLPFFIVASLMAVAAGAYLKREVLIGMFAKDEKPPVMETAEDKARALFAKGQEAYGKNRLQEAIHSFEAALAAAPRYAKAHRALGIARAKQNRAAEAVEHYRTYLELEPSAPDAPEVRKIVEDYEKAKAAGAGKPAESKDKGKRRRR